MIPEAALRWSVHRYSVERVALGTSWLGDARVVIVSHRRHAQRGVEREVRALRRWADREWRRKHAGVWHPIGDVEAHTVDSWDLFTRNLGAYCVEQRAVRIDDTFRRWLAANPGLVIESTANTIEIAVDIDLNSDKGADKGAVPVTREESERE